MIKPPSTIGNDWAILPIALPPSPAYPKSATHHVYLQPHKPRIPTPTDSRSLFLINIPTDSTEAHFRAIISTLIGVGRFESITFNNGQPKDGSGEAAANEQKSMGVRGRKRKRGAAAAIEDKDTALPQIWDRELHRSGSMAVVELVDERSVKAVLKGVKKLHKSSNTQGYPIWGEGLRSGAVPALGSARYLAHHKLRYPDAQELQASVDAFMTVFNAKEEETLRKAKRARNVPDDDGFVTVSRGGRTGPARMEEAERKRDEMRTKEEKRKSEMGDFYRFQGRERRKEEVGILRKKFEEDRRRVEGLRERRGRKGFRPEQ